MPADVSLVGAGSSGTGGLGVAGGFSRAGDLASCRSTGCSTEGEARWVQQTTAQSRKVERTGCVTERKAGRVQQTAVHLGETGFASAHVRGAEIVQATCRHEGSAAKESKRGDSQEL